MDVDPLYTRAVVIYSKDAFHVNMVYTDSLVFMVYVICHVLHMTHEGVGMCSGRGAFLAARQQADAHAVLFER